MRVRAISRDDAQIIDKLVARGTLPKGRNVGELLMHYDAEAQPYVPDANGTFVFTAREGSMGNMGLIQTTDRVTRTANRSGSSPTAGRELRQRDR